MRCPPTAEDLFYWYFVVIEDLVEQTVTSISSVKLNCWIPAFAGMTICVIFFSSIELRQFSR